MTDDPYVYPNSTVLRNTLDIRDAAELAVLEGDLTRSRAVRLASSPLPGSYDLAHLQRFHRELLVGLYDWAGELRPSRSPRAICSACRRTSKATPATSSASSPASAT